MHSRVRSIRSVIRDGTAQANNIFGSADVYENGRRKAKAGCTRGRADVWEGVPEYRVGKGKQVLCSPCRLVTLAPGEGSASVARLCAKGDWR